MYRASSLLATDAPSKSICSKLQVRAGAARHGGTPTKGCPAVRSLGDKDAITAAKVQRAFHPALIQLSSGSPQLKSFLSHSSPSSPTFK